jgi:hypothetical protein
LKGGEFDGKLYQSNLTWIGLRTQNSQTNSNHTTAAAIYSQSGITFLVEVLFDTQGRFLERQVCLRKRKKGKWRQERISFVFFENLTLFVLSLLLIQYYTYVGGIDVLLCDEPNELAFPIPYSSFSLFTYPGILIGALILRLLFPGGQLTKEGRKKVKTNKLAGTKEGVIPVSTSSSSSMSYSKENNMVHSPSQQSLMGSSSEPNSDSPDGTPPK